MKNLMMIGGDTRSLFLYHMLREDTQFHIATLGLLPDEPPLPAAASCILLGAPAFSADDRTVMLQGGKGLYPENIARLLFPGVWLCGGWFPAQQGPFEKTGARLFNLFEQEEYQLRNARLTAMGALSACGEGKDFSYAGEACLVTGFGRVARCLTELLTAAGAEVTVAARSSRQREEASAMGCRAVPLESLALCLPENRWVFNTVPARIFSENLLPLMGHAVYAELASVPYGLVPAAAGALDYRFLPGIPGKMYPRSAAKNMLETLRPILDMTPGL